MSLPKNSLLINHRLDQIAPVGFKFQNEHLYDRNIWRHVNQMNQFNPMTQWKQIIDLQITELYEQIPVNNQVLKYLCLKNHRDLLKPLIKNKKTLNFNFGLEGACEGGFKDLAQWMVDLGATWWNRGLENACRGGHRDLAQMMIDRGADDWDWGLRGACEEGHLELAQWMMELGATNAYLLKKYFPYHQ